MGNEAPTDQPPARASRRPRDLIISLLVLLVPVLLLIGGYQILTGRTQPVAVDPAPAVAEAREAGLPAAGQPELDEQWVPISAAFAEPTTGASGGGTLRIGYVTPSDGSVQLIQSTLPADELLPADLPPEAAPAGNREIAGEPWQYYTGAGGEHALVLLEPELTIMVVGLGSEAELAELAAASAPD
ncbi:DUF4245 family protein [Natronosporangium hydrolyticum]|uniref:DUF4245 family protein n=1 Tax=Natronosporangium hydrolyticum TaxID=2811111 RepID=A0A895YGV0_9ACTN|nr:DUF4245 family protein [Natronosporangium hydrolyticum]QSB15285.1 DUF4245 family protein [Natronosporangium hydrolyticum]